ncbi:MAG: hypothetical protein HY726_16140 [Candidatus Rokubacteria bacterium]|nr:hypothetical protein [Candidatus Rokubacteria bacterium]
MSRPVADLTPEQVAAMAAACGLPMAPDDLAEVTHRLNALLDALAPLGELPLNEVEPTPIIAEPLELARSEGASTAPSEASPGNRLRGPGTREAGARSNGITPTGS